MSSKQDREELKRISEYADRKRQKILEFVNLPYMKIIPIDQAIEELKQGSEVFAIIEPMLVQMLDYEPIHRISYISEASESDRKYLVEYWQEKYEVDVEEFHKITKKVGLVFSSYSEYYDSVYTRTYDYPDTVIANYVLRLEVDKV
jgi:hypothetical protein